MKLFDSVMLWCHKWNSVRRRGKMVCSG